MRFKSGLADKYCIYAVAGTNSVSFAIDYTKADTKGLLGFAVKRTYPGNKEYFMPGFKVFQNEKKDPNAMVSTEDHPIQSFVWDDFTLKPNETYTYTFYAIKGKPGALVKGKPIVLKIKTEPAFSTNTHDIFFNRGIASSQAYAREFNNTSPDKLAGKKQQDAFDWLGRDLYPAMVKFVEQAKKDETILACFYEFNYLPFLKELKKAIDRGVNINLVIDGKMNGAAATAKTKAKGNTPRDGSLAAIKAAKIPMKNVVLRQANKARLQHNKFMVYLQGKTQQPVAVWTGSTNITESGIFGQTNVGHWVRDNKTAALYQKYWTLLSKDPGGKDAADFKTYQQDVTNTQKGVTGDIPKGITPIFSPRATLDMLNQYFTLVDKAKSSSAITLAFGVTATLKDMLIKHSATSPICFMMLEKPDAPAPRSTKPFVALGYQNNVYEAFGAFLQNPVYEWVRETNMKKLGITSFVNYIHSKFLIQDALGNDPIVITGSANFSPPSTNSNDENMIMIRGDKRVADIYFTEFNRLFNHYYFRAVVQELANKKVKVDKKRYYLGEDDSWTLAYKSGSLRFKRVELFTNMAGAVTLK